MKKERNNTIITEYCYEKTNYNLYQSCLKEKVFSDVPNVAKFSLERTLSIMLPSILVRSLVNVVVELELCRLCIPYSFLFMKSSGKT